MKIRSSIIIFYYTGRIKFGLIVLILFVLFANTKYLKQEFRFRKDLIGQDSITLYEQRFEDLKKELPAHGIVGYITNKRCEEVLNNVDTASRYYLTQYSLSPIIIDNNPDHDLVIGNFDNHHSNKILENRELVKDFGRGVLLLKRKAK